MINSVGKRSPVDAMSLEWKWGDQQYPSDGLRQEEFFGFSEYTDGPTGQMNKQLHRPEKTISLSRNCSGIRGVRCEDDSGSGNASSPYEQDDIAVSIMAEGAVNAQSNNEDETIKSTDKSTSPCLTQACSATKSELTATTSLTVRAPDKTRVLGCRVLPRWRSTFWLYLEILARIWGANTPSARCEIPIIFDFRHEIHKNLST
ncbi:hypothetical protein F5882DRAFT_487952 [Hyaloscypha sp. PMI_1271]|nr:hypothetical protein F5882DRAFT_487952 [Hyaloscypha sp. PMI_1271]